MKPRPVKARADQRCENVLVETDMETGAAVARECGQVAKVTLDDEPLCGDCLDVHWQDVANVSACEREYGDRSA